jgi:hypothetical protein
MTPTRSRLTAAALAVAVTSAISAAGTALGVVVWGLTWMNGDGASASDMSGFFAMLATVCLLLTWAAVRVTLGVEVVRALGWWRWAGCIGAALLVGPAAIIGDAALLHGVIRFRIKNPVPGITVVAVTILMLSALWASLVRAALGHVSRTHG